MAKAFVHDLDSPLLRPATTGKASIEHKRVLAKLIGFVVDEFSSVVNYDHIHGSVKRSPIPLRFEKHIYDLSFVYGDRLIFIDIQSERLYKRIQRKQFSNGKRKKQYNASIMGGI